MNEEDEHLLILAERFVHAVEAIAGALCNQTAEADFERKIKERTEKLAHAFVLLAGGKTFAQAAETTGIESKHLIAVWEQHTKETTS